MQLNRPFATVTPTLDGDVLGVLGTSQVVFTINQIQRILTTASARREWLLLAACHNLRNCTAASELPD